MILFILQPHEQVSVQRHQYASKFQSQLPNNAWKSLNRALPHKLVALYQKFRKSPNAVECPQEIEDPVPARRDKLDHSYMGVNEIVNTSAVRRAPSDPNM
jgi:hypothetical protein